MDSESEALIMGTVAAITNPISLVADVVSAVFALLAMKWKPKGDGPDTRRLFYFAICMAFLVVMGGLFLAWHQLPKSLRQASPAVQRSPGVQNPNVNSTGNCNVNLAGNNDAPITANYTDSCNSVPSRAGHEPSQPSANPQGKRK